MMPAEHFFRTMVSKRVPEQWCAHPTPTTTATGANGAAGATGAAGAAGTAAGGGECQNDDTSSGESTSCISSRDTSTAGDGDGGGSSSGGGGGGDNSANIAAEVFTAVYASGPVTSQPIQTTSFVVNLRTRRGVGAPYQCPLASVASYLIYAHVCTFR